MPKTKEIIGARIGEHQAVVQLLVKQIAAIEDIARLFIKSLGGGGKILFCGNGGSAADAQHVAAELLGRFKKERRAWPAIALVSNPSVVTAIGNDYGFEHVFARQVEAFAKKGDVVVCISTSGNSPNVLKAVKVAHKRRCVVVGITGKKGGKLRAMVDTCFSVQSDDTARIQEVHILLWHIVCELVELHLAK